MGNVAQRWRMGAIACVLAGFCLGVSASTGVPARATMVHRRAPEFVRAGLDGTRVDLRAYRGKVVLLDFWATWCAPCQVEMPRFVAWQTQYGPQGLQVIGISMDDDAGAARSDYKKLRLNYPVAMGDAKLGELYGGVLGLPLTFLIDRKGVVRAEFQGEADLNAMERQMRMLLSER
jgi:peroxiredoxin